MASCRRMQIDPYLQSCTKLKSKWIKDLNINSATWKLIEEKVGSSSEYIGTGDNFQNRTPVAQTLRSTIINGTSLNWKDSVKQRTLSIRQNSSLQNEKRSSPTPHLTENWYPKIYEDLKKLDVKIPPHLIKKWGTDLNKEFSTKESQMVKIHLKNCSTLLPIWEKQIKTTLRYHLTPVRMAKIKNANDNLCWRGCTLRGIFLQCW